MITKKASSFLLFSAIFLVFILFLFCPRPGKPQPASSEPAEQPAPERRNAVVRAIEKVMPSVVNIGTEHIIRSQTPESAYDESFRQMFDKFLRSQKSGKSYSLGSGFIIDSSGLIVTNAHVVERASKIVITLNGGKNCEARIIADDPLNDIALLKLENPPAGLQAIRCDNSGKLFLGETVIAVGNPFGLDSSITVGALSGTRRRFVWQGRTIFSDILQTDAIVYPGNSGGPLVNIEGNVIGMNMSVFENAPGIGFAIPLSRIENVLATWMLPERFGPVILGIIPAWQENESGVRRIVIANTLQGSPAALAKIPKNVQLLRINGKPVENLLTVSRMLMHLKLDAPVVLETSAGTFRLKVSRQILKDPFLEAERKLSLKLTPVTPTLAQEAGYSVKTGLLISGIMPDTLPELQRGDLLIKLGSHMINSADDLAAALRNLHYNDSVHAVFLTTISYLGKSYLAKRKVLFTIH